MAIERQWILRKMLGRRLSPATKSSTHMAGTTIAGGSTIDTDEIDNSAKPKPEKPRTTPATKTQAEAKARISSDMGRSGNRIETPFVKRFPRRAKERRLGSRQGRGG